MTDSMPEAQMSPDASPAQLSPRSGVRRVNNVPVFIAAGVVIVFLGIMAWVAADRAARQHMVAQGQKDKGGNSGMFASEIAGKQKDGIIPAEVATPPPVPVPVAHPDNLDAPPTTQKSPGASDHRDDELERIRMTKMQQFEEAVKAKTTVQAAVARSAASPPPESYSGAPTTREEMLARLASVRRQFEAAGRDDPTAAYKARLAQIQAAGVDGGEGESATATPLLKTAAVSEKKRYLAVRRRGAGRPLEAGFPARTTALAVRAARGFCDARDADFRDQLRLARADRRASRAKRV